MMHDDNKKMFVAGHYKFNNAYSQSFFNQFIDLVRGKSLELLSFDEVKDKLHLQEQAYRGLQDIPLDRIAGSVGRSKDFTRTFLPKHNSMSDRWSRIYALFHSLEGPPPIECYKIDDVYFVRDGNHRVSVALHLGHKTIEGYVTELPTPIDIEPDMTPRQWQAAAAYSHFLTETGLHETRPEQVHITMTEPGGYQILMEHIRLLLDVHNCGLEPADCLTLKEGAIIWYDTMYRPAITLIRKYNALDIDSGHTEADLYLWMVGHIQHLKEEYGDEKTNRLSDALVDYLAMKKIPIPKNLVLENDDELTMG